MKFYFISFHFRFFFLFARKKYIPTKGRNCLHQCKKREKGNIIINLMANLAYMLVVSKLCCNLLYFLCLGCVQHTELASKFTCASPCQSVYAAPCLYEFQWKKKWKQNKNTLTRTQAIILPYNSDLCTHETYWVLVISFPIFSSMGLHFHIRKPSIPKYTYSTICQFHPLKLLNIWNVFYMKHFAPNNKDRPKHF